MSRVPQQSSGDWGADDDDDNAPSSSRQQQPTSFPPNTVGNAGAAAMSGSPRASGGTFVVPPPPFASSPRVGGATAASSPQIAVVSGSAPSDVHSPPQPSAPAAAGSPTFHLPPPPQLPPPSSQRSPIHNNGNTPVTVVAPPPPSHQQRTVVLAPMVLGGGGGGGGGSPTSLAGCVSQQQQPPRSSGPRGRGAKDDAKSASPASASMSGSPVGPRVVTVAVVNAPPPSPPTAAAAAAAVNNTCTATTTAVLAPMVLGGGGGGVGGGGGGASPAAVAAVNNAATTTAATTLTATATATATADGHRLPKDYAVEYRDAIKRLYAGYVHTHWSMAGWSSSSSSTNNSDTNSSSASPSSSASTAVDVLSNLVAHGMPRLEDLANIELHRMRGQRRSTASGGKTEASGGSGNGGGGVSPTNENEQPTESEEKVIENILRTLAEAKATANSSAAPASSSRAVRRVAFIRALCAEFSLDASAGGAAMTNAIMMRGGDGENNNSSNKSDSSDSDDDGNGEGEGRGADVHAITANKDVCAPYFSSDDEDESNANTAVDAANDARRIPLLPFDEDREHRRYARSFPRLFPRPLLEEELLTAVGLAEAIVRSVKGRTDNNMSSASPSSSSSPSLLAHSGAAPSAGKGGGGGGASSQVAEMTTGAAAQSLPAALWQAARLFLHALHWGEYCKRSAAATAAEATPTNVGVGADDAIGDASKNGGVGEANGSFDKAALRSLVRRCVDGLFRCSNLLLLGGGGGEGDSQRSPLADGSESTDASVACASHALQPAVPCTRPRWTPRQARASARVLARLSLSPVLRERVPRGAAEDGAERKLFSVGNNLSAARSVLNDHGEHLSAQRRAFARNPLAYTLLDTTITAGVGNGPTRADVSHALEALFISHVAGGANAKHSRSSTATTPAAVAMARAAPNDHPLPLLLLLLASGSAVVGQVLSNLSPSLPSSQAAIRHAAVRRVHGTIAVAMGALLDSGLSSDGGSSDSSGVGGLLDYWYPLLPLAASSGAHGSSGSSSAAVATAKKSLRASVAASAESAALLFKTAGVFQPSPSSAIRPSSSPSSPSSLPLLTTALPRLFRLLDEAVLPTAEELWRGKGSAEEGDDGDVLSKEGGFWNFAVLLRLKMAAHRLDRCGVGAVAQMALLREREEEEDATKGGENSTHDDDNARGVDTKVGKAPRPSYLVGLLVACWRRECSLLLAALLAAPLAASAPPCTSPPSSVTDLQRRIARLALLSAPYHGGCWPPSPTHVATGSVAPPLAAASTQGYGLASPTSTSPLPPSSQALSPVAVFLAESQAILRAIDDRVRDLTALGGGGGRGGGAGATQSQHVAAGGVTQQQQQHQTTTATMAPGDEIAFFASAKALVLGLVGDCDVSSGAKWGGAVVRVAALAKYVSLFARQGGGGKGSSSTMASGGSLLFASSFARAPLMATMAASPHADAALIVGRLATTEWASVVALSSFSPARSVFSGTKASPIRFASVPLAASLKGQQQQHSGFFMSAAAPSHQYLRCQAHLHIAAALEAVLLCAKVPQQQSAALIASGGGAPSSLASASLFGPSSASAAAIPTAEEAASIAAAAALLTPAEVCVVILGHYRAALACAELPPLSAQQQQPLLTASSSSSSSLPSVDRQMELRVRLARALSLYNLRRYLGQIRGGGGGGAGGGGSGGSVLVPSDVFVPSTSSSASFSSLLRPSFEAANAALRRIILSSSSLSSSSSSSSAATAAVMDALLANKGLPLQSSVSASASASTVGGGIGGGLASPLVSIDDALAKEMQWVESLGLRLSSASAAVTATLLSSSVSAGAGVEGRIDVVDGDALLGGSSGGLVDTHHHHFGGGDAASSLSFAAASTRPLLYALAAVTAVEHATAEEVAPSGTNHQRRQLGQKHAREEDGSGDGGIARREEEGNSLVPYAASPMLPLVVSYAILKGSLLLDADGDYASAEAVARAAVKACAPLQLSLRGSSHSSSSSSPSSSFYPSPSAPLLAEGCRLLAACLHARGGGGGGSGGSGMPPAGGNASSPLYPAEGGGHCDNSARLHESQCPRELTNAAVRVATAGGLGRSHLQALQWGLVTLGEAPRGGGGGEGGVATRDELTTSAWAAARARFDAQIRPIVTGAAPSQASAAAAAAAAGLPTAFDRIAAHLPGLAADY